VSKKLLISDANIIIDIIAGELVEAMFSLHYEFATPDILYVEELKEQHSEIIDAGLNLYELSPKSINATYAYLELSNGSNVSANDCMALVLAQQEQCDLLTGDSRLRQLAITQGVNVRGTLWLVESMLIDGLISADNARSAYQKMISDGSRLPVKEIKKQLDKFDCS